MEFHSKMLELELLHIASGRFEYRAINTFPFNVFYVAMEPDSDSILENLTGNELIPATPDLVMVVPRNLRVRRDVHEKNAFFSVHFNLSLSSGFDLFDHCQTCFRRQDPVLVEKVRNILKEQDPVRATCMIHGLLFSFCSDYIPHVDRQMFLAGEKYRELMLRLRKNITARTTVSDLASELGMRADVFSRVFHREAGFPPSDVLKQLLTQKISRRLLETQEPLKVLADELGFCSEYHLSAFFKRQTGTPPSVFRRQFSCRDKT